MSRSIRLLCVSGVAFGMHAAHAQETQSAPTAPLQRVEVTGSRIRQVDLETAQPIQVMTQEQIQKTGLVTVGDIINNMASAGSPDFSKGGSLVSNREQGGQYANLRNLGANRLLVLVDGKRWTASVNGYTDMSTIPSSLIDRIEVLKDGASAIYGSDAISGVVNIILKKSMEGGQISLYEGANQRHGDGKSKDFSVTYGAGSDKASILFSLSHTEQGAVFAKDRDITSFTYGPNHSTAGLGTGPWGRIRQVSSTGGATGFNQYLNHTGSYDGAGTGSAANVAGNYHTFTGAADDTFNSTSQMMFQDPTKLDTIFTKGSLELPYNTHFTTTAMFAQRNSSQQVAGYPLNSNTQASYPVYVDANSYYNPYPGQNLFFYRRTIERPRITDNESRTLHIDATLAGEFNAIGRSFNWDVGYNHSQVSGTVLSTGNLNLLNLKKALGPSFMNSAGVVQCGTAAAPIALANCVPFNILGGPSASNDAALDYVMSTGQATYGSTVNSATANIGGEVYTLPAGAIGFAAGLEHREVRGYDRPGQFEQSGYSTDLAGNTTDGRYTVKEAYLEFNVPLLKDAPFAKQLSLDLATRHSDYSNFGTTNNSKVSFMWKPVNDLLVRGTWGQGFRAPTVGDTFGGGQQTYDTYLDPCDSRFGDAARNPAVAANCASKGVPANFRQLNQNGVAITGAGGVQGAYPFQAGAGNAYLQPETAITRTVGFVYSPSFLPGFSTTLDLYRIKIDNRITAVSATYIANQCYVENIPSFCTSIQRNAAGEITSLARGNANLGQLSTDGADLGFAYRFPMTPYGRFSLRSDTAYTHSYKVKSAADGDWQEYNGDYTYYRFKSVNSLDWSMGNWSATWTARYYSPVRDECWDTDVECSNPTGTTESFGTGYNKLGAQVYHDLNVGYKTSWKGQIQFGINNAFDKKPRIAYAVNGGASSSSSVDPDLALDRFFYVRYNQSF
ncbi:TonB-dependent receptor plug domain-containing protein [Massilia forsythiae]|uniref:TonB-dependent receptor plug domain-containing protein n=1 Tax=Massilia forsythiae TaxID=2728020 RepID=UPI001E3E4D4B|nr:TonB-dependent receptor [Massilia forsythiae]